ncbi:glycoside hydrolase family 88 protein [Paenibacillus sp. HB172176]|uniref:glycoside hydrolase family 88/105 protein n=1 Tax=Paenibacillus sp. HB172176 TaxID=2493690 RepID=UPI00143C90A7|nr:glycoside hydrolase family 88 protein [Paenibacillus sp. HB172176]
MTQTISTDTLERLASRVFDYMVADHSALTDDKSGMDCHGSDWGMDINKWDWNPGVGVIAISHYYGASKQPEAIAFLTRWIEANREKALKFQHVNNMAPFTIFPDMFARTGDEFYRDTALEYGEWIIDELVKTSSGAFQHGGQWHEQVWADTIFMVILFFAKLAKMTGNEKYADVALEQLLLHLRLLEDTETGVLFHGYHCDGHHLSAARWTRGNSWIVVGTPLVLAEIEGMRAVPEELISRYRKLVDAIMKHQAENGLWSTILDRPSYYQETSGSAGIGCGLACAVRIGLLPASYREATRHVLQGVIGKIKENGEVTGVSGGTPIMPTIEAYNDLSCYPTLYGQGLTLMLLSEFL